MTKNKFKIEEVKEKKKLVSKVKKMHEQGFHLIAIVAWPSAKELKLLYFFALEGQEKVLAIKLNKAHPHMDSILSICPTAFSFEQECMELFGIWFDGNPNMGKRMFLSEDFKAIPFQKEKKELFKGGLQNA